MQNFNMNVIFTAYHVGTKAVLGVTDEERAYLDIYMMLYQGRAPAVVHMTTSAVQDKHAAGWTIGWVLT